MAWNGLVSTSPPLCCLLRASGETRLLASCSISTLLHGCWSFPHTGRSSIELACSSGSPDLNRCYPETISLAAVLTVLAALSDLTDDLTEFFIGEVGILLDFLKLTFVLVANILG